MSKTHSKLVYSRETRLKGYPRPLRQILSDPETGCRRSEFSQLKQPCKVHPTMPESLALTSCFVDQLPPMWLGTQEQVHSSPFDILTKTHVFAPFLVELFESRIIFATTRFWQTPLFFATGRVFPRWPSTVLWFSLLQDRTKPPASSNYMLYTYK